MVSLVDARNSFETTVYTSPILDTYDYDTCSQNGGWGDDSIVGDGCYSAPVAVDVPVSGFESTEFYVQFTFECVSNTPFHSLRSAVYHLTVHCCAQNNDRNMHLNDDAVNMLVAACSGGAGAELIDPMSPANYCSDFRTPDNYDYTPNFVSTPLGPMKAVCSPCKRPTMRTWRSSITTSMMRHGAAPATSTTRSWYPAGATRNPC